MQTNTIILKGIMRKYKNLMFCLSLPIGLYFGAPYQFGKMLGKYRSSDALCAWENWQLPITGNAHKIETHHSMEHSFDYS